MTDGTAAHDRAGPHLDVVREVRLGLVMYGGVSLAIYMNGVSQELYHLVRATAPASLRPESNEPLVREPSGTEFVYRRLGQSLEALVDDPGALILDDTAPDRDISTRFVIDVLSGSSAGGINAIFLAKALANDQSIGELQTLWQEQGDMSVLLNDKGSRVPGLTLEHPPASLLNSGRMYAKLLDAFQGMEGTNPNSGTSDSPYVQELDLWVTTTDLRGVTFPLKLSNGLAFERRYRTVFHFVYGTEEGSGADRNDFQGKNNPMLAFAARCTSAFPFAFKPMIFNDMSERLRQLDDFRALDLATHPWQEFYQDYFPPPESLGKAALSPEAQLPFLLRPFADGGALDNKPFTWTTDTLARRRADVPVNRKLIFIEPDPGHPESQLTNQDRPNAIQNFAIQGLLPREETIRQDLQAILDRNRTIERIDRVLRGVVEDVFPEGGRSESRQRVSGDDWGELGIAAGIEQYGRGYGGYQRLKVATVTDDLTSLVASLAGFDQDSDELLAMRYLVRRWRDDSFEYQPRPGKKTFNRFLLDYDLQHRLRRLTFLRSRADALYAVDGAALGVIRRITGAALPDELWQDFRDELRTVKGHISDVYVRLRLLGRTLRAPGTSPLAGFLTNLRITRKDLHGIIDPEREKDREANAKTLLDENGKGRRSTLVEFAESLADLLRKGIRRSGQGGTPYGTDDAAGDLATHVDPAEAGTAGGRVAREVLQAYSRYFDDFDMVAFPMLYGTDAGEADPVEIVRIAPEDAKSIIDERCTGFTKRKTRGWKYNHFGAFLDPEWRKNDIMFGRLDAAECLINAFVPESNPDRVPLLQKAQREIILESLSPEQRSAILGPEQPSDLSDAQVVDRFRDKYRVTENLAPGVGLPTAARGIDVTSKVLKGIAGERGVGKSPIGWLARLGSLLAGMVELAVPGAPRGMVFRRLVPLVVMFEAVMVFLGFVFGSSSVRHVGILALVLTVLAWLVVGLLASLIRGRRWPIRLVLILIGGALLLAGAIAAAAGIGQDWSHPSRYWHDLVSLYHHVRPAPKP
jgi:patatin-related protein